MGTKSWTGTIASALLQKIEHLMLQDGQEAPKKSCTVDVAILYSMVKKTSKQQSIYRSDYIHPKISSEYIYPKK